MLSRQEILDLLPSQLRAELPGYPVEDQEALFDNVRTIVAKVESKGKSGFFERRVAPLIKAGVTPREALSAARKLHSDEFSRELKAKHGRPNSGAATASKGRQELSAGNESIPRSGFYQRRVAPLVRAGSNAREALSAARRRYVHEFNAEQSAKLGR
jgi:hypothetical protein